jgi:hypothetical protein
MHAIDTEAGWGPAIVPQVVKTFDTGTVDGDEYGAFTGFSQDGQKDAKFGPPDSVPIERRKKVIIVGAGINGIQQASILLKDGYVGHQDIHIFDALEGYGGVWQKNKYPGCACDVPAMIYTTSYNINRSKQLERYSSWLNLVRARGLTCTRLHSFLCETRRNRRLLHPICASVPSGPVHSV